MPERLPRRDRGLTLLELLAVIIIFTTLLGMTVYFLSNAGSDLGVDATAYQLASQLRAAHQLSRSGGIPGWVKVDLRGRSVALLMGETVREFHFEEADPGLGAFGQSVQVQGTEPGRIGHALRLPAGVAAGEIPVYAPDQGIAVEFWFLRRRGRSGRGVLASVGRLVEIASEADGRITARAGSTGLSSGNARLPEEQWCRVQLVHSGRDCRLILNGNPIDVQANLAPNSLAWTGPEPLTIGDARRSPAGLLDEFRVSLIVPRDPFYLPAECVLELVPPPDPAPTELLVAFDGQGRLDPSTNPGPVRIAVIAKGERKEVEVGPSGSVRTFDMEPPEPPSPDEDEPAPAGSPGRN